MIGPGPSSRYRSVGTSVWTAPDGRQVPYLRRRFLPAANFLAIARKRPVGAGDRVDNVAAVELGDPELSWLLADANLAMRPSELNDQIGRVLDIPLPSGLPGPPNAQ
jgi:hypothetical protein